MRKLEILIKVLLSHFIFTPQIFASQQDLSEPLTSQSQEADLETLPPGTLTLPYACGLCGLELLLENFTVLNCKCSFHKECLKNYAKHDHTCSICKKEFCTRKETCKNSVNFQFI